MALWSAEISDEKINTGIGNSAVRLARTAASRVGVRSSIAVWKARTRRTRKSRMSVATSHARLRPLSVLLP
jgi:hypothetical protein